MTEQVTKLKVFVASPGDVRKERKLLDDVIDELNRGIAAEKGLVLELVRWETHAWPDIGEDAQDVISRQIAPYDVFVGIMWNRFGTPTKRAESGTKEEFERAYALWKQYGRPQIMFYFNRAPFSLSSEDEMEQKRKILDFKQELGDKGALYWEYDGPDDFERLVHKHLTQVIEEYLISQQKKLIETYRKNLQQLGLQRSIYIRGEDVPLAVMNSIEETQEQLRRAEAELAKLEGRELVPPVSEVSIPADVVGRDIAVSGDKVMGNKVHVITRVEPNLSEISDMLKQLLAKTSELGMEPQLLFNPVFNGRGFEVENDLCFVLMPFEPEDLQIVYQDFIKPTVERVGLRCVRADDIFGANAIIEDIWAGINRARFVIAELTGKNPNVFYEVGICHTVGKEVIFLAQSMGDIPFDLRHLRVLLYDYTPRGCQQLAEALYKTVLAVIGRAVEATTH